MAYAALTLAIGGLMLGMRMTRFVGRVGGIFDDARQTFRNARSRELRDEEKEVLLQRAALNMFGDFFALVARLLAALAGPVVLVMLCLYAGFCTLNEIQAAASNGYFIGASTLVLLLAWRYLI